MDTARHEARQQAIGTIELIDVRPDDAPDSAPMSADSAVNFAGVMVDAVTYDDMFRLVDSWIAGESVRSHHIACINAYCAALALDDPYLTSIYNSADIAGPDGMPFVYWIRWLHKLACDRFYAPSVVSELIERSQRTGYSFYFYGGAPEVLERMITALMEQHPHLRVAGHYSPPFRPLSEDEDREVCERIDRASPDILCVGLGTPKQDYWIDAHLDKIRGTVMISCGATFDFLGGRVRMAPDFVQRSGFEWLYRLMGPDRRRLLRRYTIMNVKFLWNFGLQLLGRRHLGAQRKPRG